MLLDELILAGNTRQQQHLGAYSFATSGYIDLNIRGLPQSGAWNYLREEITVALECRRPVRMPKGIEFLPNRDMPDDMWSNAITLILARIINFCFEDAESDYFFERRKVTWEALATDVAAWRENLPDSFKPFSQTSKMGNVFPAFRLIQPCHGALQSLKSLNQQRS